MINLIAGLWHSFIGEYATLCSSFHRVLCKLGKTPSDLFGDAKWYWVTTVGCVIALGIIYKVFIRGKFREVLWRFMDRYGLSILFAIAWSMGFIVYCVGGYYKGFGMLSVMFMSLIHATEMFVGGSDISAVHQAQHENAFYMFMFGLSHFLAVLCSLLFIIRQIGFFFVSKMSAWFASVNYWGVKDSTFVFWGINEASLLMAESIKKEAAENENSIGSFNLIFVRTRDDAERESEGFTPENMYDKVKIHRRELTRLRHLNCKVVSGRQRLSTLTELGNGDILRGKLGLNSLSRIISKRSSHTYIFMIGEDGDANMKAVLNLKEDRAIKNPNVHVDIYCHCRKSAKTRSLEYYGLTHQGEHTEIHIFDTSELSVNLLKLNSACLPVQHVEVNKDATIDTPFNAMIVGFGETGQEALRFLYEFGAFINSSKRKSPFHCTVFDRDMEIRKGVFLVQTPFLRTSNEVTLLGYGIDTTEYWRTIEDSLIHALNYIIICPGSDDLALQSASNLCSLAIRCRTDESPKKLTICIRSYAPTNVTRLNDFCKEINSKYQAYGINVVAFGQKEKIFTYDSIVNDKLLRMAMDYHFAYENSPQDSKPEILWRELLKSDAAGNFFIDEIEEIERKCKQNYCNALHGKTKLSILDRCSIRRNISDEIRENMARLEHERWVACMHINGWQRLESPIVEGNELLTRHTVRKLHTDLCPWEEIRKWDKADQRRTQGFDYKVLETTLKLAQKENNNNE